MKSLLLFCVLATLLSSVSTFPRSIGIRKLALDFLSQNPRPSRPTGPIQPTWQDFSGWSKSYTSTGTAYFDFSCGILKRFNLVQPAILAVNHHQKKIHINITNSIYIITEDFACVTAPSAPGVGYVHHGWNYSMEVNGSAQVIQMGKTGSGEQRFIGPEYDIGSCGVPEFASFETNNKGQIVFWGAWQTFDVLQAFPGELDCSLNSMQFNETTLGPPDPSLFDIPSECYGTGAVDFCTHFDMTNGFPATPPFPGPDYINTNN